MATARSDEELVERALNGEEDAFGQIFDRYRAPVYSTAYRIIQDPEAARDATQEIFVKIHRSLRNFDPRRARFSTWIYRLATNQAIDAWRSRRARGESQLPQEAADTERMAQEGILAEAIGLPTRATRAGNGLRKYGAASMPCRNCKRRFSCCATFSS